MKKFSIATTGLLVAALAVPTIASASTVIVKNGDTLYGIATKNNLSVNDLKSLNKLTSNSIYPGQTLAVSKSTTSISTKKTEYRTVKGASVLNVRNGAGNSYDIIATIKEGTKVEVLSSKNGWYYISVDGKKGYSYSTYFSGPTYITSNTGETTSPSPSTSSSSSTSTSNSYHTVDSGETLWKISTKYGVSVNDIKKLNNLSSDTIFKGEKLLIKKSTSSTPTSPQSKPVSNTTQTIDTYKVQSGDTLFGIANKYNMNVSILKSANGLSSNTIYVGQTLKVGGSSVNASAFLTRPAEGTVTSEFGPRIHPIYGNQGTHYGVDFAKAGNVQVKAAADGVVTRSYFSDSYGEVVFIKHVINGQSYETLYAHMKSESRSVQVGDKVKTGQFLGWMGSTGNVTGQHLHFELHKENWNYEKSTALNPLSYLK